MGKLATENNCMRLPVAEEFYSVQGEGCNTGRAAYFIRLAGCDVRCPFCDSKATWTSNNASTLSPVDAIAARAAASRCPNVVITGGEPLMYNLAALCAALRGHGLSIWLETSGAHPLSGSFDWICVSPKTARPPMDDALTNADELKVVISNANDFAFAERCAAKTRQGCSLLLQAEWNNKETAYQLIFNYVLKNPKWRISVQTHKILNIR